MPANAEMIRNWNEVSGPKWVALQDVIDRQIAPLGERALGRAAPCDGERAIDVGCGCGATTLALAERVGDGGEVLGLDLSAPMLARARELAAAAGRRNVRFVQADAQTHALPGGFDLLYSRFGVMFFDAPEAAFKNLRLALRPGGRLAFVCWQGLEKNPWMVVPAAAVARVIQLPPPAAADAPGPFAFADPERVRGILAGAGFGEIAFESVEQVLAVGPGDLEGAVQFLLAIGPAAAALRSAEGGTDAAEKATVALRSALSPHLTPNGVEMASASWVVTARNV